MSKPRYACVRIAIAPDTMPGQAVIWLFEIDAEYSLAAVQQRFVEANKHVFGNCAVVTNEIGRIKNMRKLLQWADRKQRNRFGLPALTGWCGPVRLAPLATRM